MGALFFCLSQSMRFAMLPLYRNRPCTHTYTLGPQLVYFVPIDCDAEVREGEREMSEINIFGRIKASSTLLWNSRPLNSMVGKWAMECIVLKHPYRVTLLTASLSQPFGPNFLFVSVCFHTILCFSLSYLHLLCSFPSFEHGESHQL